MWRCAAYLHSRIYHRHRARRLRVGVRGVRVCQAVRACSIGHRRVCGRSHQQRAQRTIRARMARTCVAVERNFPPSESCCEREREAENDAYKCEMMPRCHRGGGLI